MYSDSMNTKLFNSLNKKIVIGSDLSLVDTYLKSVARKENQPILNIEKATISSLAKLVISAYVKNDDISFINIKEAQALMHSFLMSKRDGGYIYSLIPDESFSLKTSSMVYTNLLQIRNGLLTKPTKVDQLISDFEKYLLEKNLYDDSLLIKKANELLQTLKDTEVKNLIGINSLDIFILDEKNNTLNYQESLLISSLENVYNIKREIIELNQASKNVKKYKVNAYGFANEVNYIINRIKTKNINLEDVNIYVSDNTYNNLIKGLFEISGVNYRFNFSLPALNNNVISFMNNVLNFYISHYSIDELHNIYKNKSFIKKEDKDVSYLGQLRSDLGQIKYVINNSYMGDVQKGFLLDLISLDQTSNISIIYSWLITFTKRNVNEKDFDDILPSLESLNRYFSFTNLGNISFVDKMKFIQESLLNVSNDEAKLNQNESCVNIYKLKSSKYLNRRYNFFLGLSARQFQEKEIDFPLINDNDLKEYLDNSYYVSYVGNVNEDLIKNINNLINTLDDGEIYFIKSEYDSSEFKSLSPSQFYMLLDAEEIESSFNEYKSNPLLIKNANEVTPLSFLKERKDLILSSVKKLTPSRLEKLLNCPYEYCYSLYLDDFNQLSEFGDTWLSSGGDKGTIAHEILELYLLNHYQKFDEEYLNKIFNETYKKYSELLHYDLEDKKISEFHEIKEMVKRYLERFYKSQENFPYHILFTELEFDSKNKNIKLDDIEYDVDGIKCFFHGVIDRVDGYIDENNKLHLRFIDYKTTSESSFTDKEKNLHLSQAVIYPEIIKNLIRAYKNEIETKINKSFDDVDLSDLTFIYELLTYDSMSEYTYNGEKYLAQKEYIDTSIRKLMNEFIENDFVSFLCHYEPEIEEPSEDHDNSRCKYCAYKANCPLKIELGGDKAWKE